MLHELLIALSGHPSPLFDGKLDDVPHVTAAERALLQSTGRLAKLHHALRSHLHRIAEFHPSTVCRAVANTILIHDLARFQQDILDVEREILSQSSTIVGAYNIVPLSAVVSRFEPWRRRLEWFWEIACFMLASASRPTSSADKKNLQEVCSGTALIDKLLKETYTGYDDIEDAALRLCKIAEQAWLRQLALLLVQGREEQASCPDLFLAAPGAEDGFATGSIGLPPFIAPDTAESLVNVCKTLNYFEANQDSEELRYFQKTGGTTLQSSDIRYSLLPRIEELLKLGNSSRPITTSQFDHAIVEIRTYLSKRVTEEVLPISRLLQLLRILNSFFLGQSIEFLDALIAESDKHLRTRHAQANIDAQKTDLVGLAGAMMKESEVQTVLSKTWPAIMAISGMYDDLDPDVEWARENITLQLALHDGDISNSKKHKGRQKISLRDDFNDLLLSAPIKMDLKSSAVFSLFLTSSEMQIYDSIRAYFSAIRRTHNHVKDLWRESSQRKAHPSPIGPPRSNSQRGREQLRKSRKKLQSRLDMMRMPWHACNWIVMALNEIWEYFWGEVVHHSWEAFYAWANKTRRPTTPSSRPSSAKVPNSGHSFLSDMSASRIKLAGAAATLEDADKGLPRDPIVLGQGHQEYLKALHASLLLDDDAWRSSMRRLLTRADNLVAVISRLQHAQKTLDLQEEGVIENTKLNYGVVEEETYEVVLAAAKEARKAISEVIAHLKKISNMEHGPARELSVMAMGSSPLGFQPWAQSNIDRLLLRLDMQMSGQA